MITGSGTSESFGLLSTSKITDSIDNAFRAGLGITPIEQSLYDNIFNSLKTYLVEKDYIVTFEDIYQSIQDVATIKRIPNNRSAPNRLRPRVGATHTLNSYLLPYSDSDLNNVQDRYLDNILDAFLMALPDVSEIGKLESALKYLEKKYVIWSFTLNYDNLIDNIWPNFTSGFTPGKAPRGFNPNLLLSSVNSLCSLHSHLHGSLSWGFPINCPHVWETLELHEFDNPQDGVRYSKSRSSGIPNPSQQGEIISLSPIITGLDKTELVFRKPFFTNFLTLFESINRCTDILIAGYSFSDHHVNMAIEQCRRYHPGVKTYIIDKADNAKSFFKKSPNIHKTILPDVSKCEEISTKPGWWKIDGHSGLKTDPVFLWLKGFKEFCADVVNNGLPV